MQAYFYDIESLDNVFTLCNFNPNKNFVEVYYLIDTPHLYEKIQKNYTQFQKDISETIYEKNKNFKGQIYFFDLKTKEANDHLATIMGLSDASDVTHPFSISQFDPKFKPVCDTDPNYDPNKHPYIMGYNSQNYDTTMLAQYFATVYELKNVYLPNGQMQIDEYTGQPLVKRQFAPITAQSMRLFNNELFLDKFKDRMPNRLTVKETKYGWSNPDWKDERYLIRRNFIRSGRHIDVALLNEKQRYVGLKRLLGILGHQILESDKLGINNAIIHNLNEFYELVAYNVSDVVNLRELFNHGYYKSQFELKRGLLEKYPELIYEEDGNTYKPKIDQQRVRYDRLTINSSSAQFAIMALCPYGNLIDDPVVSFMYPSERKAKEENIPRVNVLEETKKFFYQNFKQFPHLIKKFDKVYNYYKSIEGKNFNDSKAYIDHYGMNGEIPEELEIPDIYAIPRSANNLFYYYKDGTPSSGFVTFSFGGIHGQEANVAQFEEDYKNWQKQMDMLEEVKSIYPDPLDMREAKELTLKSGETVKWNKVITSGLSLKKLREMPVDERKEKGYRNFNQAKPILFEALSNGNTELNKSKYTYSSFDHVNHEDFTSYYPNLLRMMEAFYNEELGYDRYGEIFFEKEHFGKLMKDKSLPEEKRSFYKNQREGIKLILNSASGAANARFDNAIKMANKIIAMRIIGQLFTYRVGQAQTLEGAKIISTNTDGLYSVMEEKKNNEILERISKDIYVAIEPEPMYLISKDTNNRMEMNEKTGKVTSTAGGSLACYNDTSPLYSLTHPAIIDWALGEYLIMASHEYKAKMYESFNRDLGKTIIESSFDKFETPHLLRMYQNVIASSVGSNTYNFATRPDALGKPIILQHYNRVFIMKDNTPNCLLIQASRAKKITPATIQKRKKENLIPQIHDELALEVLAGNGISALDIPKTHEAAVQKVTNIEPTWHMFIENGSLFTLPDEEIQFIKDNLDIEKYLDLLQDMFEKNWMNKVPEKFTTNDVTIPEIYYDV